MSRFLWTQKQNIGPKARLGHAMAFDSDRSRIVLFGGDSLRSQLFNDTWEWDGENWTQMADIGPRPRREFAMVYDAARQRVLLFGGSAGAPATLGDTWEWDGQDWSQLADSGPAPRTGHAMAFDNLRNRVVLFGGETPDTGLLNDTWEWDGEEWTQQEDTGPSARRGHALAFDSIRGRVVLFGGNTGTGLGLGDTWEWDGTTWTQVANFGPDPSFAAAMVFKGDRVALYGGIDSINSPPDPRVFGNTWEWDGRHWTQRQDIGPGPRWLHAMAYDSTNGRIVLFGGIPIFAPIGDPILPDHLLHDTWQHSENRPPIDVLIANLDLLPDSLQRTGERATATVTLTRPAPAGGATIGIAAASETPGPDGTLPMVDPTQLLRPEQIVIPPGASTGQFVLEVGANPPAPGGYLVGVQALGSETFITANLTITPAA